MTMDGQGNLHLNTLAGNVTEMRLSSTRRWTAPATRLGPVSSWRAAARSASPWVPTTTANRWL